MQEPPRTDGGRSKPVAETCQQIVHDDDDGVVFVLKNDDKDKPYSLRYDFSGSNGLKLVPGKAAKQTGEMSVEIQVPPSSAVNLCHLQAVDPTAGFDLKVKLQTMSGASSGFKTSDAQGDKTRKEITSNLFIVSRRTGSGYEFALDNTDEKGDFDFSLDFSKSENFTVAAAPGFAADGMVVKGVSKFGEETPIAKLSVADAGAQGAKMLYAARCTRSTSRWESLQKDRLAKEKADKEAADAAAKKKADDEATAAAAAAKKKADDEEAAKRAAEEEARRKAAAEEAKNKPPTLKRERKLCKEMGLDAPKALSFLRQDFGPINWALFQLAPLPINFIQGGSQGLLELLPQLKPDLAAVAILRIAFGAGMLRRMKYVKITWLGPSVSAMKRAQMLQHRDAVSNALGAANIEIQMNEEKDLNIEAFIKKVEKVFVVDDGKPVTEADYIAAIKEEQAKTAQFYEEPDAFQHVK